MKKSPPPTPEAPIPPTPGISPDMGPDAPPPQTSQLLPLEQVPALPSLDEVFELLKGQDPSQAAEMLLQLSQQVERTGFQTSTLHVQAPLAPPALPPSAGLTSWTWDQPPADERSFPLSWEKSLEQEALAERAEQSEAETAALEAEAIRWAEAARLEEVAAQVQLSQLALSRHHAAHRRGVAGLSNHLLPTAGSGSGRNLAVGTPPELDAPPLTQAGLEHTRPEHPRPEHPRPEHPRPEHTRSGSPPIAPAELDSADERHAVAAAPGAHPAAAAAAQGLGSSLVRDFYARTQPAELERTASPDLPEERLAHHRQLGRKRRVRRLAYLLSLEVQRILDELELRQALLLEVWSKLRLRKPLLSVLRNRYEKVHPGDLLLLPIPCVEKLEQFYQQVDAFRLYLMITEDMPTALEQVYHHQKVALVAVGKPLLTELSTLHGQGGGAVEIPFGPALWRED